MEKSDERKENNKDGNKISEESITDIGKVKSIYIIEFILSFLLEKKKLDMIIYNKKYQDKFNINLDYYKKISGKYIIGERNGMAKEYYIKTNELIFEGNYLNGKKNGNGIEYYSNGKIKFEGEYSKGIKVFGKIYKYDGNMFEIDIKGKGKEEYNNGKIKFEGEYFNGKRWKGTINNYNGLEEFEIKYGKGYGKEYNYEGNLIFEGNILNGERNGKGKEYDKGKLIFEGDYLNGEKNGKGKEYTYKYVKDKKDQKEKILEYQILSFEGEYLNGKRNGKGKEFNQYQNVIFEGEYLKGERNGKGKEYKYCELSFEGEYLNGKRNGKGKEYYFSGELKFEGEYINGIRIKGKEYLGESSLRVFKRAIEEKRMKKIRRCLRRILEDYALKIEKEKEIKKIYDEKLFFEGEYLGENRNHKGKIFFNGIFVFEGYYYY